MHLRLTVPSSRALLAAAAALSSPWLLASCFTAQVIALHSPLEKADGCMAQDSSFHPASIQLARAPAHGDVLLLELPPAPPPAPRSRRGGLPPAASGAPRATYRVVPIRSRVDGRRMGRLLRDQRVDRLHLDIYSAVRPDQGYVETGPPVLRNRLRLSSGWDGEILTAPIGHPFDASWAPGDFTSTWRVDGHRVSVTQNVPVPCVPLTDMLLFVPHVAIAALADVVTLPAQAVVGAGCLVFIALGGQWMI